MVVGADKEIWFKKVSTLDAKLHINSIILDALKG